MVEFFKQYGSYISALIVIIFQIVKAIINNKKMNMKFDDVSSKKSLDEILKSKDSDKLDQLADIIIKKLDNSVKKMVQEDIDDQEKK